MLNCIALLEKYIYLNSLKIILAISYIMKVREVSYNQIQMDKWKPVIDVCFIFEKSWRRLDPTELSVFTCPPRAPPTAVNFFWLQLDKAEIPGPFSLFPGGLEMNSERPVLL